MSVFYPEALCRVCTNVYFIISYPVPPQGTVHWDDHQTERKKSLQKPDLRPGFYGLHGEFERLSGFWLFLRG